MVGLESVNAAAGAVSNASKWSPDKFSGEGASNGGGSLFGDLLKDEVKNAADLEDRARTAVNGFMTGTGVDVHEVMIASEKASMAFEMALAVRNKAVQSYQSVMSMQF